MEAQIKKIQITPMKFSKEGDCEKAAFATITLEVPMGGIANTEAVRDLFDVLDREWVTATIERKQRIRIIRQESEGDRSQGSGGLGIKKGAL